MRKTILLALLCAALVLCACARADDWNVGQWDDWNVEHWVGEYDYEYYYHSAERCRLARNSGPLKQIGADTLAEDYGDLFPCPVCCGIEDPKVDADAVVTAYERGGTLVISIPDACIRGRMLGASEPAQVPEALLRENENQLDDIARLVHGQDYGRWRAAAVPGADQKVEAGIPDLDSDRTGALLMARRHIGTAWVLVVRPNEPVSENYTLPVVFYHADLRVASYDAGSTIRQGDGSTRWTGELTLSVKKSNGRIAFRDVVNWTDLQTYVVRDGDVNVAVFRARHAEGDGTARQFDYCAQRTLLAGYVDGKDVVYVCPLTDGEVAALNDRLGFSLHPKAQDAEDWLPNTGETFWEADHEPVVSATLPDGTVALMDQAVYPIGTGFVSFTLTRPRGGIAYYNNQIDLAESRNERWVSKSRSIKAYADGDPERAHSGYFCDHVTLVVPLEEVGVLEPGLYSLMIAETHQEGTNAECHLEFRVTEDAPKPTMPERRTFGGEGLIVLPHTPPHADVEGYNSCMDDTRVYEGGNRTRVLAGDMVFDLRGVDESWGWGICSAYNLFAYPEGQPERARQILANLDYSEMSMADTGDGLLLYSDSGDVLRCDYDGGNLTALLLRSNDALGLNAIMPVGGGAYLIMDRGNVCYTALDDFAPRPVYRAMEALRNSDHGGGFMVYAEGRLIVAEKSGIVALDALHPNADGTLPINWLTDEYDAESGVNGYGYIVLDGRLYAWSEKRQATISMKLDGTDIQKVSKERYWFSGVTPGGTVLALWGSGGGMFGDERTDAALFFPIDPAHPTFDPENAPRRTIQPGTFDFVMGDYFYHRDEAENETRRPLSEIRPDSVQ